MALSIKQDPFPEPDGPLTVFVAIQVGGVKYQRPLADLLAEGAEQLQAVAAQERVTLMGKPRFRRVEIGTTGDVFLMGEQDWY